jgi:Zn-dependent peptidase ImmA (M78 family)
MRRGFKTDARDLAREMRAELELTAFDPLDPWALAEHLAIPVWRLSDYQAAIPEAARLLAGAEQGAFSAMVAFVGHHRVVIHNDAHAITRQRADIAHELAHAILLHEPHVVRDGKAPGFDQAQEDEAGWLGGVLLVTEEACLAACRRNMAIGDAATSMGVSEDLMRWRINATGARKRVARARDARRNSNTRP